MMIIFVIFSLFDNFDNLWRNDLFRLHNLVDFYSDDLFYLEGLNYCCSLALILIITQLILNSLVLPLGNLSLRSFLLRAPLSHLNILIAFFYVGLSFICVAQQLCLNLLFFVTLTISLGPSLLLLFLNYYGGEVSVNQENLWALS